MNKRPPNLPLGVALLTLALVVIPRPAESQLFGTQVLRTSSDHPELPSPGGYRAFALVSVSDWLDMRLSYDRVSHDWERPWEVCRHYAPNMGCREEPVETSTSLGTLGFALIPSIQVGELLRLGLGAGFGMTQISARSLGVESGRKANFETPKTAQLGVSALFSFTLTPLPQVPLSLVGTAAGHRISFKSCVSYEEVYAPFCGSTVMKELGLGLAFSF